MYNHTTKELEAVPENYIHLRHEDGRVIHKTPAAFQPRFKSIALYDEETGEAKLDAKGDPVYKRKEFPPANNLKDNYLSQGWVRCQKNGNDLPGPKATAKKATAEKGKD